MKAADKPVQQAETAIRWRCACGGGGFAHRLTRGKCGSGKPQQKADKAQ